VAMSAPVAFLGDKMTDDSRPDTVPPAAEPAERPVMVPATQLAVTELAATPAAATAPLQAGQTVTLGTLELREERAEVQRERVQAGQVTVRREVQTRTETVTTELKREVLIIETRPGGPAVYLDDVLLPAGETREIVLYDERVSVTTTPYVREEVRVGKRAFTEEHHAEVTLRREVLVVDDQPDREAAAPDRPAP
jgi:uncharacterized protein (TIGR02271 family)